MNEGTEKDATEEVVQFQGSVMNVVITCGQRQEVSSDLAGKTVLYARQQFAAKLSIPEGAEAYVNGVPAGEAYMLLPGNVLEFFAAQTRSVISVLVSCGANSESYPNLTSKEVGYVRRSLVDVLNIPNDAEARVNGKTVPDSYILLGGDSLEFIKPSGVKGGQ